MLAARVACGSTQPGWTLLAISFLHFGRCGGDHAVRSGSLADADRPACSRWPRASHRRLYGGTERVIAWLVDELVELGHDVTLFASGDSRTKGKAPPSVAACAATGTDGRGSERRLRDAGRSYRRARARLRRDPLPRRLAASSGAEPDRRAVPDDDARPSRPSRSAPTSSEPFRTRLSSRFPTTSAGRFRRRTGSRRSSTVCRRISFRPSYRARFVPGLSWAADGRQGPRRRDTHRTRCGDAAADRRQDTARGDGLLQEEARAEHRWRDDPARRRGRRRDRSSRSSPAPRPCCFRSIGPSRSVWS